MFSLGIFLYDGHKNFEWIEDSLKIIKFGISNFLSIYNRDKNDSISNFIIYVSSVCVCARVACVCVACVCVCVWRVCVACVCVCV